MFNILYHLISRVWNSWLSQSQLVQVYHLSPTRLRISKAISVFVYTKQEIGNENSFAPFLSKLVVFWWNMQALLKTSTVFSRVHVDPNPTRSRLSHQFLFSWNLFKYCQLSARKWFRCNSFVLPFDTHSTTFDVNFSGKPKLWRGLWTCFYIIAIASSSMSHGLLLRV